MIMPGILREGSGEEPVPRYGAPRRIRSARPDAWDRPQWCATSRRRPGTECCRRRPCSAEQWPRLAAADSRPHENTGCREAQIDDHATSGREPVTGILDIGDLCMTY